MGYPPETIGILSREEEESNSSDSFSDIHYFESLSGSIEDKLLSTVITSQYKLDDTVAFNAHPSKCRGWGWLSKCRLAFDTMVKQRIKEEEQENDINQLLLNSMYLKQLYSGKCDFWAWLTNSDKYGG